MLYPERMARMASSSTGAGTGVSQTPWARLMPPMRSHSVVMERISDCMTPGASSLRARREVAGCGVAMTETEAESKGFCGAEVWDTGKSPLTFYFTIALTDPAPLPSGVRFDTSARAGGGVKSLFPRRILPHA